MAAQDLYVLLPCTRTATSTLSIDEATQGDNWFMPTEDVIATGVCLRVENGFFRVFPYENPSLIPFEAAVRNLNPVVAVKIRSSAVLAAMAKASVFFFTNGNSKSHSDAPRTF